MDSNNLSLFTPTVVSQPQQNGNFEMDAKFFQVNAFGPPVSTENQIQDKMASPSALQPSEPIQNSSFYWSEFNQYGHSNPNWGYNNYQNYSVLPQAPVAIPVSDFGPSQTGPQAPLAMGPTFQAPEHNNAAMGSNAGPGSPYFSPQGMHPQPNFHHPPNEVASPGARHSAFQFVQSTTMHSAIKPDTINETDMQSIRSAQEVDFNQRNAGVSPGGSTNKSMQATSQPPKAPRRRSTGVSTKSSTSSSERPNNNGGNSSETYECPICNKVYEHRDSLRRHKRDFHKIELDSAKKAQRGQPTDFQCDICGKYLSNRCSLKRHKKSALCSKTLESVESSNSQTKTESTVLSSSEVSNENMTPSSYDNEKLTFHGQPETMTGSKPGTSQQLNGAIKKRKVKPANEKQYNSNGLPEVCHICGKGFAHRRGLGKHLKRIHNTTRPTKKELKELAKQKRLQKVSSSVAKNSISNSADNQSTNGELRTIQHELKPEISQIPFSETLQHQLNFGGMVHQPQNLPQTHMVNHSTPVSTTPDNAISATDPNLVTPPPTDKDMKKCDICGKSLKKVNIARHMKSAHKIEGDQNEDSKLKYAKVECNYCQAVMLKGNLPRHKRSHHKIEYEKEKETQGSPSSVEVPRSTKKAKYEAPPPTNGDGNFSSEYRPNNDHVKSEPHQFHAPWSDAPQMPGTNVRTTDFRSVNDMSGIQQYPIVSQAPNNPDMQMNSLDYQNFNHVVHEDPNRMSFVQPANNHQPMGVVGYGHLNSAEPGQTHLSYGQPPTHLGMNVLDYGNLERHDVFQNPILFAQNTNNQVLDLMDYGNPPRQDLQLFSQIPTHPDLDLLNYRNVDGSEGRDGQLLFTGNDQNLNLLNYGNVHENIVDVHHQSQTPPFHPPPPSNSDLQSYRHVEETVQPRVMNVNVAGPANSVKKTLAPDTSECPICEKIVPTSELYQHKISHELICHICGKDDIRLPDVPAHGQTHVASLDCELCGYKAQAKIKLWEHMNTHLRIKPLICLECGWSFGNSGSVQYHMKSQHSSPSDLFKCDHCDKTFVTEQAKRGHQLSHYGTTCPFCKQEFPRKKDLADHIKAEHRRKRQAS